MNTVVDSFRLCIIVLLMVGCSNNDGIGNFGDNNYKKDKLEKIVSPKSPFKTLEVSHTKNNHHNPLPTTNKKQQPFILPPNTNNENDIKNKNPQIPLSNTEKPPLQTVPQLSLEQKWKNFFNKCSKYGNSNIPCERPYYTLFTDTIPFDNDTIINNFIEYIDLMFSSMNDSYKIRENAIEWLKSRVELLIFDKIKKHTKESIEAIYFDPENYPKVSIKDLLNKYIYFNGMGLPTSMLYFAFHHNQENISLFMKAIGMIIQNKKNYYEKEVCKNTLYSIANMYLYTHNITYNWFNNRFINKMTTDEINKLNEGITTHFFRVQDVISSIIKHISFLFDRKANNQDFLELFRDVFNKNGTIWNNELKRRALENQYLYRKYYIPYKDQI